MSNQLMFRRLLIRSLRGNKVKFISGFLALLLAASMVSAMLSVLLDLPNSLGKELRRFGANFIIKSSGPGFDNQKIHLLNKAPFNDVIIAYAPFKFIKINKGDKSYQLNGTDFKALKRLSPWLRFNADNLTGREILVGRDVANELNLKKGDLFQFSSYSSFSRAAQRIDCLSCHKKLLELKHRDRLSATPQNKECLQCHESHEKRTRVNHRAVIGGLISSGGSEDKQFFAGGDDSSLGLNGLFDQVKLSVLTNKISEKKLRAIFRKSFPDAQLISIKQISEAEKKLLARIQLLMVLLTIVVFITCGLSVVSTLTGNVMQRSGEIGLMKSLGATNHNIVKIFMTELLIIVLMAGFIGYFSGLGIAALLAKLVFKTVIGSRSSIAVMSIGASLILAVIAGAGPLNSALRIQPAITLRKLN